MKTRRCKKYRFIEAISFSNNVKWSYKNNKPTRASWPSWAGSTYNISRDLSNRVQHEWQQYRFFSFCLKLLRINTKTENANTCRIGISFEFCLFPFRATFQQVFLFLLHLLHIVYRSRKNITSLVSVCIALIATNQVKNKTKTCWFSDVRLGYDLIEFIHDNLHCTPTRKSENYNENLKMDGKIFS